MPEEIFALSAPKASQFKDYSKYVQDLIRRDVAHQITAEKAIAA